MSITKEDIAAVKARGFLRNRKTEAFSGRVVVAGGLYTAENLTAIAECAKKYGSGKVGFTSRLAAEIVGIPFEDIPAAEAFLAERGLYFGGTGAKVRPITACKGTTCVFGNIDTQELARTLHERFYIGHAKTALPHKFKIGIGGCPNSCMKPSLNDVGIEGYPSKEGFCRVYVGGTWGKNQRIGTLLSQPVLLADIPETVEKILLWYRENGYQKERLGATIDRVGAENLEKALTEGDLIARRHEILAAPIAEKPQ